MQGGEEQLHADHMALSPGQHSTVPTAPPVAKENTAVTSSTASTGGHFMGTPTLVSPQGDRRSICGLNHWESDCDGEREAGLPTSSARILANWVPACRAQRVNPTSSFALLQPNLVAQCDEGTWWGASLPNSGLPMRRSASPGAWSAHAQQKSWVLAPPSASLPESLFRKNWGVAWSGLSQSHPGRSLSHSPAHQRVWPPAPSGGRADKNTQKLHNPAGEWAELVAPRAKSVALFGQWNWGTGWLVSRWQRALVALGVLTWWARVGKLTHSPTYCWRQTSARLTREPHQSTQGGCRAHPTALLTVAREQRARPVAFPVCRAKLMASPD